MKMYSKYRKNKLKMIEENLEVEQIYENTTHTADYNKQ